MRATVLFIGCLMIAVGCVRWDSDSASVGSNDQPSLATGIIRTPTALCGAQTEFFNRDVWPILSQHCLRCHTVTGRNTSFNLLPESIPGYLEANFISFRATALKTDASNTSLVLTKSSHANSDHGGGQIIAAETPEFSLLQAAVSQVARCQSADRDAEPVVLLSPYLSLRKATLSLVGRLPTISERKLINQSLESLRVAANFEQILDQVLTEAAFYVRLQEIYNDTLLTNKFAGTKGLGLYLKNFTNSDYYSVSNLVDAGYSRDESNLIRRHVGQGIAAAPLQLIKYVVKNNLPFTEILTADYAMVNAYSATLFEATVNADAAFGFQYGDSLDQHDFNVFKPASLVDKDGTVLPQAGVLSTLVFLSRYPSSASNRNRHRARTVYQYFLDTDINEFADRAALNLDKVLGTYPTLEDPQCKICHDPMDPVAGLFKHWNRAGAYVLTSAWFDQRNPPQMLPAGYTADSADQLPGAENAVALPWLVKQITQDVRFAVATVKTLFQALIGRLPEPSHVADNTFIEQLKTEFMANGFDLKWLIKTLVMSDYFRVDDQANAALFDSGAALGVGRILSPEQLHRKIKAVSGGYTWRSLSNQSLLHPATYGVLYGGINSDSVIHRTTEQTAIMTSIQQRIALQSACQLVPVEFALAPEQRELLPFVKFDEVPGFELADANITRNLQHLVMIFWGQSLDKTDPEMIAVLQLLDQARWLTTGQPIVNACRGSLAVDDPIVQDAQGMVGGWMVVMGYLFADYKFLYE